MSEYQRYRAKKERPWKVHPVWRGIGCILIILLPIMAYAGAWMFTRENFKNHWLPLNEDLTTQIELPVINWSFLSFPIDLNFLIDWLPGKPLYNADILFFGAFLFLGLGFLSMVYAVLYRTAVPAHGPFDAPEVETQRRRRRL
jgi:hypothetical protein